LFFVGVAEGSRVGVYRAWEAAQLRRAVELWTPADLDGLALWLDAADAGTLWEDTAGTVAATNNGRVARWDDKSGNGYNAISPDSEREPRKKISAFATASVLVTDGNDRLDLTSNSLGIFRNKTHGYIYSVFSDANYNSGDATHIICAFQTALGNTRLGIASRISSVAGYQPNARRLDQDGILISTNRLFTGLVIGGVFADWNSGLLKSNLNGSADDSKPFASGSGLTSNTDASANVIFFSGAGLRPPADSEIGEIIAINTEITAADRQKLEGYLAHKWGLTANLPANHPYKSAPPTK
jgi:hypothetical protein